MSGRTGRAEGGNRSGLQRNEVRLPLRGHRYIGQLILIVIVERPQAIAREVPVQATGAIDRRRQRDRGERGTHQRPRGVGRGIQELRYLFGNAGQIVVFGFRLTKRAKTQPAFLTKL